MKIVFTSKGESWDSEIDPRFGRTEFFVLYDEESGALSHYDNRETSMEQHGAGPKAAQKLFDLQAKVLITGNGPGGNAATVLEKSGIKVFAGAEGMTLREAFQAYKNGSLRIF